MKGVIVQVGKPKSIILYNNGKLGSIPTPSDCRVGMVVTVKLNNKLKIFAISLAVILAGLGIFSGIYKIKPAIPDTGYGEAFTVEQVKILPDGTWVELTGTIIRSLGDELYIFRDATGEVTVEIDRKIWRDLSVGDTVEIAGEVDIDKQVIIIDIKNIRKLPAP